jgi:conjugative relaxase-like TrwC/TraI family protein
MLSLAKIRDVAAALGYYAEETELGREEYYSGEGDVLGRWVGRAAATAGFDGPVVTGSLEHLLRGAGLRRPVRDGAVAGIDLTFKAPKSVGLLWGIADAESAAQLGAAHDDAVAAALGYMEREACRARRGAGGAIQVRGEGFVAAAFRHASSRAGDPLLHTHVVAGNLTLGPDGKWTALDARHLFRHALTGGYLYQAELRRGITERLGLQWGPVEKGAADLVGVSRPVIDHFSQRQKQMREHMAEHGGRSPQSAQIAVLETRQAKSSVTLNVHREQWRSRAAEHGLGTREVARALEPVDHALPLAETVTPRSLTDTRSVFGRAELLQALAAAQLQGSSIAELERLADAVLAGPELVALPHGKVAAGLTEARYTTVELLELEQDLVDRAMRGLHRDVTFSGARRVESALEGRTLSPEQRKVVVNLCSGGEGVSVVRAPAGTGKTFVLDAAREAWQSAGIEVLGCALSARAALELNDQAAIPSTTIAQLTGQLGDGGTLPRGGVLVVDEAGMVGTRDLATLAESAETARAKLVLVGDDRQLPEIQAGGAFRALAERLPANELHEVRRQRETWDREALDQLRTGDVERWASAYRDHGQITVGDSAPATRAALVND